MERLELKNTLINLYKNNELTYSFDWRTLKDIWNYATIDDIEGINADYVDGLMSIILTTASGQGGLVAVIDTANNVLIHCHEGSFAIKVLIAEDKIITLYHIICYGNIPSYCVDCIGLKNTVLNEVSDSIKLPEGIEFNDEKVILALSGEKLTVRDDTNCIDIDISALM